MLQLEAWESFSSQAKHWTNSHIPHWKMGFIIYQDHLWEITLKKRRLHENNTQLIVSARISILCIPKMLKHTLVRFYKNVYVH